MRGLLRSVRSGPWYVRALVGLVLVPLLMWPVLLDQGAGAVSGFVAAVVAVEGVRLVEDGRLREETGWDRGRRVREVEFARSGVLPADPVDRHRVALLVTARLRQRRGGDWVLLVLFLVCSGLVVIRHDRYPDGWALVAAAWFVLLGLVSSVVARRLTQRDTQLLAVLDAAGAT